MKVGSLVECVKTPTIKEGFKWPDRVKWVVTKGNIYTVREIDTNCPDYKDSTRILVEEGIVGYHINGTEYGFSPTYFVEIQPPMTVDIEELLTEKV